MGQSKVKANNKITGNQIISQRHETINSLLDTSNKNTNFLSDYLKNIINNGPDSARVQSVVSNYREQILPQVLGSLGEGKSSSALNQSLATGAQSLAQTLDADKMGALQLLQQLTEGGSKVGLAADFKQDISKSKTALNTILNLMQGGGKLAGKWLWKKFKPF